MATTREKLIDLLADLPDSTEIGIEDIYLVAIVGTATHSFTVGDLTDESIQITLEAFIARRGDAVARIREIHEAHAGESTDEGAMVVTLEGYLNGVYKLFTNDVNEAFRFKDKAQAEVFVAEFADALHHPQVLDHP